MKKLLLSLLLLAGCGAQAFEFDSCAPRWSLTKAMHYDKMAQHITELSHYFATGADLYNAGNCKKIVHYYAKTRSYWKQQADNSDDVSEKSMHKQDMRRAKRALELALDLYHYRAQSAYANTHKKSFLKADKQEICPAPAC